MDFQRGWPFWATGLALHYILDPAEIAIVGSFLIFLGAVMKDASSCQFKPTLVPDKDFRNKLFSRVFLKPVMFFLNDFFPRQSQVPTQWYNYNLKFLHIDRIEAALISMWMLQRSLKVFWIVQQTHPLCRR